mmetsp:Transcript_102500/g.198504  ORF Transcript_102500/g.198504 Transcript_102500/m.198504 type:complete len:168 (-) Transcript_102500:200-703(-)
MMATASQPGFQHVSPSSMHLMPARRLQPQDVIQLGQSPSINSLGRTSGLGQSPSCNSIMARSAPGTLGESTSRQSLCSITSDHIPAKGPPKTSQVPQHQHQVAAGAIPRESTTGSSHWVIEQVIDFDGPIDESTNETEEVDNKDCDLLCLSQRPTGLWSKCASARVM